jgi:hypothetical protein
LKNQTSQVSLPTIRSLNRCIYSFGRLNESNKTIYPNREETKMVVKFNEVLEEVKVPNFLRLDIQFFAGEGDDPGEGGNPDPGNDPDPDDKDKDPDPADDPEDKDKKEEKTFKQEDVNKIAAREAKKATEKLLKELGVKNITSAKQGLEEFRKMQDDQKSDAQKAADKARDLEIKNGELLTKAETLEAKLSALSKGVKADSTDDVITLAKNLVDEDTNMDDAIDQVVEKYPQFKAEQKEEKKEKKKPKFSEGDHKGGGKPDEKEQWSSAFKFPL